MAGSASGKRHRAAQRAVMPAARPKMPPAPVRMSGRTKLMSVQPRACTATGAAPPSSSLTTAETASNEVRDHKVNKEPPLGRFQHRCVQGAQRQGLRMPRPDDWCSSDSLSSPSDLSSSKRKSATAGTSWMARPTSMTTLSVCTVHLKAFEVH